MFTLQWKECLYRSERSVYISRWRLCVYHTGRCVYMSQRKVCFLSSEWWTFILQWNAGAYVTLGSEGGRVYIVVQGVRLYRNGKYMFILQRKVHTYTVV